MSYPVFDLHCDTAVELFLQKKSLARNDLQIDLERAARLSSYTQFFAFCCVYDTQGKQLPQPDCAALFRASLSHFQKSAGTICESPGRAWFHPLLSLEGPEAIDCDPDRLEGLYEQGFRMTTLTWNYRNALAGSCMTGEGLSDRGREFVREAQRRGIVIDVSHLSERAFWDLVDITTKPIVASHSNSRVCCKNVRNLTDDQFKAIRDSGGLVGMNLYAPFLNESGRASFDDVRRHLEHWLALGGERTVALGGDLDGCDVLPEGFKGVEDYNALGTTLSAVFGEEQILAMVTGNAERFCWQ